MDPPFETGKLEVVCPYCHAAQQTAAGASSHARCSRCGAAPFGGHPFSVDAESFARHVGRPERRAFVGSRGRLRAPRRTMVLVFEAAARDSEPRYRFLKANADEAGELAQRYRIVGIPTFAVLKRGVATARTAGAMTPAALSAWVRSHG